MAFARHLGSCALCKSWKFCSQGFSNKEKEHMWCRWVFYGDDTISLSMLNISAPTSCFHCFRAVCVLLFLPWLHQQSLQKTSAQSLQKVFLQSRHFAYFVICSFRAESGCLLTWFFFWLVFCVTSILFYGCCFSMHEQPTGEMRSLLGKTISPRFTFSKALLLNYLNRLRYHLLFI